MRTGSAEIFEIYLDAERAARLRCAPNLVPAPGQYVMSHAVSEPDAPLPVPLYPAALHTDGFTVAPSIPKSWLPGTKLNLRGPLGHGFSLPPQARTVALIALNGSPARLLPLMQLALQQSASVTLACEHIPNAIPAAVEIVPLSTMNDAAAWAHYTAIDLPRHKLEVLQQLPQSAVGQVLIDTPNPCGGMSECGVCAVTTRKGWRMACKDGPVFDLHDFLPQN